MAALRGRAIELCRTLDSSRIHPMIGALWDYGTPHERIWLERLRGEGVDVYFAAKWDEERAIYELRSRVAIHAALYAKAR